MAEAVTTRKGKGHARVSTWPDMSHFAHEASQLERGQFRVKDR